MGVSIESHGKRNQGVDLNLVPFVDFLSCLLAFLLMTAVLTDVGSLEVNQGVGGGDGNGPPPLTLHLSEAGVWVGREVASGRLVARVDGDIDWSAVEVHVAADRVLFPGETSIVVNTDDGQPYGEMAHALDLAYLYDYDGAMLAGGPAVAGR